MPRKRRSLGRPDSLSSLKAELENRELIELPSSYCIYRVPPLIRKMNPTAYKPMSVSIGPYHHGDKRLKSMEEVKLWFLCNFLKRNQQKSFDDYVCVLKHKESKIRSCYSDNISMESDEFVRMVLTDACFIIEYFLLMLGVDSSLSKLPSMEIRSDLILAENQLPFFILEDLFDLNFSNGCNVGSTFVFFTFYYFKGAFLSGIVPNEKLREGFTYSYFEQHHLPTLDGTPKVDHLCDMLRIFCVRLDQLPREPSIGKLKPVYNASKLDDAGIKFEVNEDEMSILRLQYSKGVLKIPRTREKMLKCLKKKGL
ncbi:UPF0481 protein At3g47200-like isoform X2 [Neltuma alba]|uniref:UPF0481 protein At3g47200-like isoform X2 n=1 Tax=Neltuma alba TaxID=207710 RepID=UPI0010A35735|nr:UPF0481 protein At3g47200-like isoform X2 [Prosopis alba]